MKHIAYYLSPIGCIYMEATETHLCKTVFEPNPPVVLPEVTSPVLQETICQLQAYFAGKRKQFDLPIAQQGTAFQQKVWNELSKIPYGEKISYKELATRAGNAKACRAAGSANGHNQIFIIVPCHRVIQASGNIGGYAYGSEMKRFLLEIENSCTKTKTVL